MSKNTRNRILLTAVAALLLVTLTIGGTLAWLADHTDPVVNEFTSANVTIYLDETDNTDTDNDGKADSWTAKMIPGKTYEKDPYVTVGANSESCYIFIEVVENDTADAIAWAPSTGWTKVEGVKTHNTGAVVYMYDKAVTAADDKIYFLAGNDDYANGYVTINDNVTEDTAKATLTFYAYAVQSEYLKVTEPSDIWELIP